METDHEETDHATSTTGEPLPPDPGDRAEHGGGHRRRGGPGHKPQPKGATAYYVAPTGSDSAAGTLRAPWASFARAQAVAQPGDTVYFRGGTYTYSHADTGCASQTARVDAVTLDKSGTPGSPIRYWAYPGEQPVFDFSQMTDDCRIKGFDVTGSGRQPAHPPGPAARPEERPGRPGHRRRPPVQGESLRPGGLRDLLTRPDSAGTRPCGPVGAGVQGRVGGGAGSGDDLGDPAAEVGRAGADVGACAADLLRAAGVGADEHPGAVDEPHDG